jgi:hypothetical protein
VPVVVLTPVVAVIAPKVRGVGFRQVPKWRMKCGHERADDPKCAGCQSVHPCLDTLRIEHQMLPRHTFGVNGNIPGIEVWVEFETSVRRRV